MNKSNENNQSNQNIKQSGALAVLWDELELAADHGCNGNNRTLNGGNVSFWLLSTHWSDAWLLAFSVSTDSARRTASRWIRCTWHGMLLTSCWRSGRPPTAWQKLLYTAFGRSEEVDLSGITIGILKGQTMAGCMGPMPRLEQMEMNAFTSTATGWELQIARPSEPWRDWPRHRPQA